MTIRRSLFAAVICALVAATSAGAEENRRMVVIGDKVFFNGDIAPDESDDGVEDDYPRILDLAAANPTVSTVVLTGSFRATGYAMDVARGIEGLGLSTEIQGECTDACIYMFVAGRSRILGKGATLGLRRITINATRLREYFEQDKAAYGWEDEFGQAAMLYDLGQSVMRSALQYLMNHGVSLEFALKIFATPREDMWWPEQDELVAGGVIQK